MRTLRARGLLAPLAQAIARGTPLLGICLGLQALFAASDEAPDDAGLGIFPRQRGGPAADRQASAHGLEPAPARAPVRLLLEGIPADAYFYFAHSYAALDAGEAAVAMCDHGAPFVAALEHENLFAVQFHPEKSGDVGARVLANFVAYAAAVAPTSGLHDSGAAHHSVSRYRRRARGQGRAISSTCAMRAIPPRWPRAITVKARTNWWCWISPPRATIGPHFSRRFAAWRRELAIPLTAGGGVAKRGRRPRDSARRRRQAHREYRGAAAAGAAHRTCGRIRFAGGGAGD